MFLEFWPCQTAFPPPWSHLTWWIHFLISILLTLVEILKTRLCIVILILWGPLRPACLRVLVIGWGASWLIDDEKTVIPRQEVRGISAVYFLSLKRFGNDNHRDWMSLIRTDAPHMISPGDKTFIRRPGCELRLCSGVFAQKVRLWPHISNQTSSPQVCLYCSGLRRRAAEEEMGCTSAKQVSAVPNGEEGQNKAYSNGDLAGQSVYCLCFSRTDVFRWCSDSYMTFLTLFCHHLSNMGI